MIDSETNQMWSESKGFVFQLIDHEGAKFSTCDHDANGALVVGNIAWVGQKLASGNKFEIIVDGNLVVAQPWNPMLDQGGLAHILFAAAMDQTVKYFCGLVEAGWYRPPRLTVTGSDAP